jgi:PAS domain S-box-containing protein
MSHASRARQVAALLALAAAALLVGALRPDLAGKLLTSNGFLPHGVCYSWQPGLVWLHVVSDLLIGFAYFSIPIALIVFARRRRDLPFPWIFLLFGLFIVSCGATHFLAVWTLWTPQYWLDGVVKAVTAMASVPTAVATALLIPRALALPSTADLQAANARLATENVERVRAETALRDAQARLEERVAQRTGELVEANAALAAANATLQERTVELRRANVILRVFMDQTPIGLALLDRDLRYVRVNDALARINGLPPASHIGRTIRELLPDVAVDAEADQQRVLRTGVSMIGREVTGETPAHPGEVRHWSVSYYPVVDGEIIGLGILCEEVTDRRRLEAERSAALTREREARAVAEAASVAKDRFLAAVSHELRNPLQSILGWVQVLESANVPAGQVPEIVRRIGHGARLQARLIDDLLDASRIVAQQLVMDARPVDLREVVGRALEDLRADAVERGIDLSTEPIDAPAMVQGDAHRLHQVVANLVGNALKFTARGGTVAVRLADEAASLVLTVTDNGRGIAPEFLPQVFEPFRQERKAPGERGLGLGLAIVRRIVELHGGSVDVASPGPGQGATFVVRLPRIDLAPHGARPTEPGPLPSLVDVCVLLVDDEIDPLESMATLLEQAGARVHRADSVDAALDLVVRVRPDVVVTDIAMPERDGYGLVAALRADPATRSLPVIALSAFAGAAAVARSLGAGFDRHLAKPVDAGLLIETVAAIVRDREH